uniref:RIC3 acetylcholine receptor chaperone n=1 Tax=Sus scrofa TaxID=9823 RepID=A0A4X1SN18_PIG
MASSAVRRVALASGLVLAASLLLPKAFLSRGKPQEPPPAPEGYPEETYPIHDLSDGVRRRPETILVDFPDPQEPSAEEIAERMELPEEEEAGRLGREMPAKPRAPEDGAAAPGGPRPETCSCCFPAQEDPAVLAEHAGFGADGPSEREEGAREEPGIGAARACVGGALRRRSPQGSE